MSIREKDYGNIEDAIHDLIVGGFLSRTIKEGNNMEKEKLIEWLKRRINHCQKHIDQYPEKLTPEKYSVYGGLSKGYWEGRKCALEDVMDFLESNKRR